MAKKFKRTAYLLYEGDQWLSKDSMDFHGVFTNKRELKKAARKLIAEQAKEHLEDACNADIPAYDTEAKVCRGILDELMSEFQTYGWTTRYTIETVTINEAF